MLDVSVFFGSHQASELDRLPPQTEEIMGHPDASSKPLLGLDSLTSSVATPDENIDAADGAPADDIPPASASRPPKRDDHGPTLRTIVRLSGAAAIPLPPSRSSLESSSSNSVFEASSRLENARTD